MATAAAAADKETRIYYLGNSLTDELKYDPFVDLAEAEGEKIVWGRQMCPGIRTCVLVMNKMDAPKRKHVVFINADRDYREGKAQNFLRAEDISRMVHAYRILTSGETDELPGYARRVPVEEIESEDYEDEGRWRTHERREELYIPSYIPYNVLITRLLEYNLGPAWNETFGFVRCDPGRSAEQVWSGA